MRIGIADSGVGGLSVCAAVEARLTGGAVAAEVELLYLNAALADDYGYNAMPDRRSKLAAFDAFLDSVNRKYAPDLLFIACNSLSVLFPDTRFARSDVLMVTGVVDIIEAQLNSALSARPVSAVVVLATPTTVEEGTYGRMLRSLGVSAGGLVEQACPGLADAISNDLTGREARELLQTFIPAALQRLEGAPDDILVLLGCTHYGYQAGLIESEFRKRIPGARVLNPNPAAADAIVARISGLPGQARLSVRFISRYDIPAKPLGSLPVYLGRAAPATLRALRQFEHDPDLCGSLGHLGGRFE